MLEVNGVSNSTNFHAPKIIFTLLRAQHTNKGLSSKGGRRPGIFTAETILRIDLISFKPNQEILFYSKLCEYIYPQRRVKAIKSNAT